MSNVCLVVPSYDGKINIGAARAVWETASREHRVYPLPNVGSLLPTNCNGLLASALNQRKELSLDWLVMVHTDVAPDPWFVDKLIAIAEQQKADLLSAVIPLKDFSGATSTAIAHTDNPYGNFTRLHQRQVRHPSFPDTFGINEAADALEELPGELRVANVPRSALLTNTGCMIYRLSQWRYGVRFRNLDDLVEVNGKHEAVFQSEDFYFSRSVAEHDGRVMATRLVTVRHHGNMAWDSSHEYGQPRDVD